MYSQIVNPNHTRAMNLIKEIEKDASELIEMDPQNKHEIICRILARKFIDLKDITEYFERNLKVAYQGMSLNYENNRK
jgi:hypothetical protein